MTLRTSPGPAKWSPFRAWNAFNRAAFTIGAKVSTTINVAMQLQDARAQSVAEICHCRFYLSDNSDGSTVTATATTSALAIGTNGALEGILTTGKVCDVITNALGQVDLNIIQSASPVTYYPVLVKPDGAIIVGGAVTF